MGDSFELIINLASELSLVIAIPKFFLVVDAVDGFALVAHLHEKIRVIIGFLCVEVDVGRAIDLEIFIYSLVDCLLM